MVAVTFSLKSQEKMGYVNEEIRVTSTVDSSYKEWEIQNSQVMVWIINSMIPEIGERYLGMQTARDIWVSVASTYSQRGESVYAPVDEGIATHQNMMPYCGSFATTYASSSFAHSGNLATSASAFLSHSSFPWIIDSGASDHMSGSSNIFSAYKPYSGQDKVRIADGTFSCVKERFNSCHPFLIFILSLACTQFLY